jgi:uncharacterized protein
MSSNASNASNADKVRAIYAAFGRGDIPAMLEHFAEDIVWEYGRPPSEVPWLLDRRGRAGAAAFFTALQALELHHFNLEAVLEGPTLVVAIVDIEATVKATGRRIEEQGEAHLWRFDDQGKVARFRHVLDTAQHERAWRAGGAG